MGMRGPRYAQRWTSPGTPEFRELLKGPANHDDKNRIDVMRRRWINRGEKAVMDWWDSLGERPWAWWRFNLPAHKQRHAERYETELEALLDMDLLDPDERVYLEQEGIITKAD